MKEYQYKNSKWLKIKEKKYLDAIKRNIYIKMLKNKCEMNFEIFHK